MKHIPHYYLQQEQCIFHYVLNLLICSRAVKNHAVINEVVDFKTLSGNLQRKISLIENEKFRLMARNVDLEREVSSLRKELLEIKQNPNAVTTIT